jgi:hypothetical protein
MHRLPSSAFPSLPEHKAPHPHQEPIFAVTADRRISLIRSKPQQSPSTPYSDPSLCSIVRLKSASNRIHRRLEIINDLFGRNFVLTPEKLGMEESRLNDRSFNPKMFVLFNDSLCNSNLREFGCALETPSCATFPARDATHVGYDTTLVCTHMR